MEHPVHQQTSPGKDPINYMVNSARNNPWFILAVGLVGIIVGYSIGISGAISRSADPSRPPTVAQAPTPTPTPPQAPANAGNPPTVDDDDVAGKSSATVTLIEFTDYQCPFCSRHYQQTGIQLKKDYVDTGKMKHVVRDFPLRFHPHAQKAAEATECAGEQGKFWEMHDILFGKQSEWSQTTDIMAVVKGFAADIGLKADAFKTCIESGAQAAEIQKDMADAAAAGINGTPGFWIIGKDGKGEKLSGALPYDTFKKAIEKYLAQ